MSSRAVNRELLGRKLKKPSACARARGTENRKWGGLLGSMAKLYRRCAFLPMSILKGEKKLCREKERSLLHRIKYIFKSVSSISQSCLTLCDLMIRNTPGLPIHHQLPQSTQTHVHWVSDAIQPSHPVIPSYSCPQSFQASGSFQMSQHFSSGGQSIGVSDSTSVLHMNTQDWFPLGWTGWISLQSKGLSRVFSNTTVQKHQFFSTQLSLWSNWNPYMTTGKTIAFD